MNKLISKIVGAFLGVTMATGIGVGVAVGTRDRNYEKAEAGEKTVTFKSSEDAATNGSVTKDGITLSGMDAYQTSDYRFYKGKDVIVSSTVGNITALSFTFTSGSYNGGWNGSTGSYSETSLNTDSWSKKTTSGSSGKQARITQLVVTYNEATQSPTISLDKNSLTVGVNEDATFKVTASNLTENFTVSAPSGYDTYFSISYTPSKTDGNHTVTLHGNAVTNSAITVTVSSTGATSQTISVTVAEITYATLYTDSIKSGDYVFMSADTNFTYVMGNTISSNRVANGTTPAVSNNKIANPSNDYVWHIAKSGDYWTIQNASNDKYLAGTSSKNQAALLDNADSNLALWTITYSSGWVFHNLGRSEATSDSGNAYLRNNTTSGWACYASSFSTGPALFRLPSSTPEIEIVVTDDKTTFGVGDTATLTISKLGGASGTVSWATSSASQLSLSASTGDSITVTGEGKGTPTITASLSGCEDASVSFTIYNGTEDGPYSVADARAEIDKSSGARLTDVYTTGIISEVTSFDDSHGSITYWISDDGTTTNQLQVYGGLSFNSEQFTSINDVVVGATVTVFGTLKKYNSIYEYDKNNCLVAYTAPDFYLTAITGLTGSLTANSGAEAWDLSTLTPYGSFSDGRTNQDISAYVDLSTLDVPGTVQSQTVRQVSVTVTPKDQSLSELADSFNVSGTINVVSGPLTDGGRYYIMNSDKTRGLSAAESSSTSPNALDLSSSNNLLPFDFKLTGDNAYEITTTISGTKYYLVCNTTATSSSNSMIRITSSPTSTLASKSWVLDNTDVETEGAYYVKENTTGTTYRYLSYFTQNNTTFDWRGYLTNGSGNPEIQFVEEGTYAATVATKLTNDLTCDNGATAPSTTVWGNISTAYSQITIANEQDILKNATYARTGSGTSTVITATGTTTQSVAEAIAKYDYVVGKYNIGKGLTAYNDFLNRNPSVPTDANRFTIINIDNTAVLTLVVTFSVLGFTTLGGYFLLRKKKEER